MKSTFYFNTLKLQEMRHYLMIYNGDSPSRHFEIFFSTYINPTTFFRVFNSTARIINATYSVTFMYKCRNFFHNAS